MMSIATVEEDTQTQAYLLLNSKRIMADQLRCIRGSMVIPMSSPSEEMHQMIEEKLANNDQKSKIVMLFVIKSSPMATFSLHDETEEFFFMEAGEETITIGQGEYGKDVNEQQVKKDEDLHTKLWQVINENELLQAEVSILRRQLTKEKAQVKEM